MTSEPEAPAFTSIAQVVDADMCIGCGLCEAVSRGNVTMQLNDRGGLRPAPVDGFTQAQETLLLATCPAVIAAPRQEAAWVEQQRQVDPIWGLHGTMAYAWAADPQVRHRAATGGALTALGMHLVESGTATFVLHVGADPEQPMRSRWVHSETGAEVAANTGSRYGPTAPLAGLLAALDREEPFAVIAKPCDLGAVHALSKTDPRLDQYCVARMTMVCGGQSRLSKSQALLQEFGIDEDELSLFRYRGYGNPGATLVTTKDGRQFQKSYQELWEDESAWELETRCKLCPDALGEATDIAAADVWPGGGPTGEDEGFNGIIVRSQAGEQLVAAAVEAGHLVIGDPISPRQFDDFQPHQVRKKVALTARYQGMASAGIPAPNTTGLRLRALAERMDPEQAAQQAAGTKRRMEEHRQRSSGTMEP